MKRFPKNLSTVLEPALQAARSVLHDLDADEIPASLRRVAGHSGRLTPPLAAKLVTEIDTLEWLRSDAAEKLEDDTPEAARAFLVRDHGWWSVVADELADARVRVSEADLRALEHRFEQQNAAAAAAKAKLKSQKADTKAQLAALRDDVKLLRKQAASAEHIDDQERKGLDLRMGSLEGQLAEAKQEIVEADRVLVELRSRVRNLRRDLANARRALDTAGSSALLRNSLDLARELDLAAASVPRRQAEPNFDVAAPEIETARLRLPPGVAPDRAEAVEWLLDQEDIEVIVDGYNLLFHLEPGEFTTGAARRNLGKLMGRFARKARHTPTVLIVFDSTLPGPRDIRWAGTNVGVVYADADRLADEEVVQLAGRSTATPVVVSSDREVREDSEAAGAVVLWSEAWVDWLR